MLPVERYRGSLLGLATGDALGATVEFRLPGSFAPVTGMRGGGPFDLKPGQWTDDTSMALCLAESLIEKRGFDPADQLSRYLRWYRQGYLSSTGACFDVGTTTSTALHLFEKTGAPFCGAESSRTAGNGALMRLAPIPLAFAANPRLAIERAADSSRTTHAAVESAGRLPVPGGADRWRAGGGVERCPHGQSLLAGAGPVARKSSGAGRG